MTIPAGVLALDEWDGSGGWCAVYAHATDDVSPAYIGKAARRGVRRPELERLEEHQQRATGGYALADDVRCWCVWRGDDPVEMDRVETVLIAWWCPPANTSGNPAARTVPVRRPPRRRRQRRRSWRARIRTARRVARWVSRTAVVLVVLAVALRVQTGR